MVLKIETNGKAVWRSQREGKGHSNSGANKVFCGEVADSPIQQFYKGKNVFITGATGFVGKVLLERLLVSCPGIETVYIMIRGTKGHSVSSRVEKLLEGPLFQHVDKATLAKVYPVVGELGPSALGLSLEDYDMLVQKTNIVIHCAANVRFDAPLTELMTHNVKGTCDLMELCKKMKELSSFVYVSTIYCNYNETLIEEKVYESGIDIDTVLGLTKVSAEDSDVMEVISRKFLSKWPNQYAFTKCMSEKVVVEKGRGLPVCIIRPGLVMPTSCEHPVPGYVDNLNGGIAMVLGMATGLVRIFLAKRNKLSTTMPADYCGNAIIACSWNTANERVGEEAKVYNYSPQDRFSWYVAQCVENVVDHARKEPFDHIYGYPCVWMIPNYALFRVLSIFIYFIPGLLGDLLSVLLRKPPMFLKTYRRIMKQSNITHNIFNLMYNFRIRNTRRLQVSMAPVDQKIFKMDLDDYPLRENTRANLKGVKQFILKENPDTSQEALNKLQMFKLIYYMSTCTVMLSLLALFVYTIIL